MSDHEINVKVKLDDSEAQKKLNDLTKKERKIDIDVDTSDIDQASKKVDGLKNKDIKVDAKVTGKEAIDSTAKSLDKATKSASGFGNTIKGFAKFGAYLNIFQTIEQTARKAAESIKEIDDQIVNLQMATGSSYEDIRQLSQEYLTLGKNLGATGIEMLSGADLWLRSGRSMSETTKLLKDSTVLSKVASMDAEKSSEVLTATLNGYQMSADAAEHINDVLSSIDLASASSAEGIGEALTKTASVANNAGLSLEKTAAIIATIKDVTQDSDSSIGNSIKSILSRMNQIKAGKFVDEETGEALNDTEKVLNKLGISMRDANGQFMDAETIIDNVAQKWSTFDKNAQKAIATAMGGAYQYNRLITMFDNYDKVMNLTNIANNSGGVAETKFEEAYLNSLEAKTKSLQASFESLSTNLVSRDAINGVLEATQALVEFIDKTNLLKGALAGVAAGGAIKGFTMLTASITQAAMQMTNFSRAMDLAKAGDLLGQDGLQQLCVLTDGLSKSQLKAVLSSEALSTAQRMQILQATGMSEAQAAATLSTMGLSTAEGTATASTVTLSGALKGLWATLMANPIVAIALAIGAGVAAFSSYNQSVEESIQRAKDITSAWDESNSSLNEQSSKYKELKSQLDSGTLSPDEEFSTRQQILDIQTQITSQYGEQAEGISLVNGALDAQLAKLQQIAAENAKTELNKSQDEYNNVIDQMERQRLYTLSDTASGTGANKNDGGIGTAIYNIAKQFEDAGLSIEDNGNGEGLYTIQFKGDASQADSTITDFMNRVSELKDTYTDQNSINVIDGFVNYSSDALKENQKILDDYQESYNKFLQMEMLSEGYGEGSVADTYNKYAEAVQKYNEVLASGDSDSINKARADFNELNSEVETLLAQGDNDKFTSLFDEVGDSLDEASIKLYDFNEVLSGKVGNSNTFKDTADDIKTASDGLKELKLDAQEVRDALITDGAQTGEDQILALADAWGLTEESIKNQDEAFTEFLSVLSEAGIITGEVASATDTAAASYDAFSSTVQTATENLGTLQSIMSESVSGSGISAENVQALKEMFTNPSDFSAVLEKTANGYHLNKEALAELQAQQETLTKSDYLSALSDQYELLEENAQKLAKAQFMGEDTSGLEATRQGILDQISSLEDLQYQYEAATSAYQDWQNAMSGGEEGDMYDSIFGNIEDVKGLYDKGLTGTNKFREFVDLMSNQDLSTASNEEIVSAYEKAMPKIERYFTEGQEGAQRFLSDIQNLNSEWAHMNEDGSWDIDFGVGNDQEIADALGIDVEAVQAVMRKLSDYGFEINLDEPVASMEELRSSAQSAQETLANMEDTSLSDINLDSNSFSEITDNIAQVEEYIDEISDSDLEPDVKTEKLENANAILEYLVEMQNEAGNNSIEISVNAEELDQKISDAKSALDEFKNDSGQVDLSIEGAQEAVDNLQTLLAQKEQLNTPAVMAVDTSQVDGELGAALAKIQEYQSAVQDLNVQTELKAQGVDIDTSAAQEKVNNLAAEIQGINPDITAKLNVDTSSVTTIQSSIQAITPEILVKAGVDSSAIANYTPGDKNASVKYKVDASAVNQWNAPDKTATLTYSITTSGALPGNKERTLTYNITTSGNAPHQGTAHANGSSVKSYRFNNWRGQANVSGNWGIKKGGLSLVGELGQEILVRGSEFHTIGDDGAEFIQTRPGDIIFNHKQTASLLENGYVTSRGKMIGGNANVNGSAYSSGSGKFNVGSSGSKASSSSSSSSNKSSSSSSSSKKSSSSNSSSAKEAAEEFEETIDWIEMAIDRLERAIDTLDLKASSTYRSWSERNQNLTSEISKVTDEINLQQQGYNRYLQQANSVGLSSTWATKVQNGQVDISTITDEDLADKISEYQQWYKKALDCRDAIEELRETESELYEQAFDHISTMFDGIVGQLEHFRNMMEGYVDQTETAGYIVSQKYYTALIDNEEATLSRLNDERNQLIASLNDAVNSGAITKESEAWFDMQSQINEVNEAIQDSTTSIIEFKNSIRDIEWDIFDKLQDSISEITSESDFLIELMSNDKLFSDNGTITDQGKSTMGLHGVNYNVYMSQADEYRKEMEAIQADLSKDPYNQELIERRRELLELQQESILAAEDEKDAIRELVSDGIETELDSLSELIDQYESALDSQKDLFDYQNEVAEKQKDIATIEKQLAAYQGDDSEEGAAKRQQLQNDLEDARADLEETQWEKSIDQVSKLLTDLQSDYSQVLNMRLDNIDLLLSDIVNNVNMEAATIRDTLISESDAVGYKMTDSMNTIWNLANQVMLDGNNKLVDGTNKVVNVITLYGDKFSSATTNVQTAINNLKTLVQQAVNDANARAQANITNTQKQQSQQTTTTKSPSSSNNSNKTNTNSKQGNGRPDVGDAVKYNSGKYYYSSDGLTPNGSQMLGQTVYITKINNADWATKPYHIARDKAGSRPLGWVALDQISGYKSGIKSIPKDEFAWTNENGNPETIITGDGSILTPLSKGSSVLNTEAHNNLWDMANDPSEFIKRNLDIDTSTLLAQNNKPSQVNNTISINIPIDKVLDYNDFIKQLQNDPKAEKLIQSIAFDQVTGRGRLGKYNVNFNK